jgi:hypothetical protein
LNSFALDRSGKKRREYLDDGRHLNMEGYQQQEDLVREQFTRTAQVSGDYALASRVAETQRLARMVLTTGSDRAADLACGPGALALRFAPREGGTGARERIFTNTALFIAGEKI